MFRVLEERFEEAICTVFLLTMASCIVMQVILRYFFSAASAWAEEVAVYSMVGAVYMGASLAIRERAHIRIVMGVEMLPKYLAATAIIIADLAWFGFLVLLFYQGTIWIQLLFDTVYVSPGLGIEQKWPQLMVPFALVLMMLRMIQVYYRWITGKDKGLPL
ncbi:MAG: TRAP transporter small permease [Deltaproteobacteria bacterium]|nr:TRAP transporter small permease [Deltaproteobacteria bacterium]